jgi:hypothetical protein
MRVGMKLLSREVLEARPQRAVQSKGDSRKPTQTFKSQRFTATQVHGLSHNRRRCL